MKIRQAGCLVAAALLLTGCAGNNTSSSEESSAETSVSAATTVDPQAIQKVNQLFATSTTIENAKQAALKQCMQGKGVHTVECATCAIRCAQSLSAR